MKPELLRKGFSLTAPELQSCGASLG